MQETKSSGKNSRLLRCINWQTSKIDIQTGITMDKGKVYSSDELRSLTARVIQKVNLYSLRAVDQIIKTIAHESLMGRYRAQIGSGYALGLGQCEQPTFVDIRKRRGEVYGFASRKFAELQFDDELAVLICRLKYLDSAATFPQVGDTVAQAKYWGKYYQGMSDPEKEKLFIKHAEEYILGG